MGVKNIDNSEKDHLYEPILDLIPANKNTHSLEEIFKKINAQEEWPIFHYGETEKIAIINLSKRFYINPYELEQLKSRLIDLHLLVRLYWILPLKNYSLKTVANWIGFKWKENNVSGSKALFWWIKYKETSNKSFLEKIIKYNQDDCLATLSILRWLIKH